MAPNNESDAKGYNSKLVKNKKRRNMEQKKEDVFYTKKAIIDKLKNDSKPQLGPNDKILESGSEVGSFLSKAAKLMA